MHFKSLGDYDKAKEYLGKALAIEIQIGDKGGEATSYGSLGTVFQSLSQYGKAKEYFEKALVIEIQTGNKNGEASSYGRLGELCFNLLVNFTKLKNIMRKLLQ